MKFIRNIIEKYIYRIFGTGTFSKLILYFCMGGLGFIIDYVLLYFLTAFAGIHYLISNIISFTVGVTINFIMNKHFNFNNKNKRTAVQYSVFVFIAIGSLLLSQVSMYLLVEHIKMHYLIAKPLATLIIFPLSFYAHKKITFQVFR